MDLNKEYPREKVESYLNPDHYTAEWAREQADKIVAAIYDDWAINAVRVHNGVMQVYAESVNTYESERLDLTIDDLYNVEAYIEGELARKALVEALKAKKVLEFRKKELALIEEREREELARLKAKYEPEEVE